MFSISRPCVVLLEISCQIMIASPISRQSLFPDTPTPSDLELSCEQANVIWAWQGIAGFTKIVVSRTPEHSLPLPPLYLTAWWRPSYMVKPRASILGVESSHSNDISCPRSLGDFVQAFFQTLAGLSSWSRSEQLPTIANNFLTKSRQRLIRLPQRDPN